MTTPDERRAQREAMRAAFPDDFDRAMTGAPDPDPELARDVQRLLRQRRAADHERRP